MSDDDISKISSVFERYKRYADISCTSLSGLIHESDILETGEYIPLLNIDMSWLFNMVDGIVKITDDPKRVDLTNIEIGLMIIEVLLYIKSSVEYDDISDVDTYDMFKAELHKSMDMYYLSYVYIDDFNIIWLNNIMNLILSELSRYDPIIVVGWVNNNTKMLSVIEGL